MKPLKKVCCMRLHTAGIVVGWLGVMGAFLCIIVSACLIGYSERFTGFLLKILKSEDEDQSAHRVMEITVIIYASINLGVALLSGVASGFLILGTMKNRQVMILPWLALHGMGIVLNGCSLFGGAITMFEGPSEYTLKFFFAVVYFAIYLYIYWGISSLYSHIQMETETGHELVPVAVPEQQNAAVYPIYSKI